MDKIEEAFKKTTNILLGLELSPISKYENWLRKNTPGGRFVKKKDQIVFLPNFSMFQFVPEEAVAGLDASAENSKKKLDVSNPSMFSIGQEFAKNALLVCEFTEGNNSEVVESNWYLNCQNVYRIAYCFHSRFCAYNIWSSFNQYSFGCYRNMNSSFCINCYSSSELSRCFEMDSCRGCSDSMFCHNCENVHDSLFCFNTKNKRYAICNVEVGKEQYIKIRKRIINRFIDELKKTGNLKLDIYSIVKK